jgi:hypothetical protein
MLKTMAFLLYPQVFEERDMYKRQAEQWKECYELMERSANGFARALDGCAKVLELREVRKSIERIL